MGGALEVTYLAYLTPPHGLPSGDTRLAPPFMPSEDGSAGRGISNTWPWTASRKRRNPSCLPYIHDVPTTSPMRAEPPPVRAKVLYLTYEYVEDLPWMGRIDGTAGQGPFAEVVKAVY